MTIPNNPAILAGGTLYIGGTPPLNDEGNLIGAGDVGAQVRAIFARMDVLLAKAGMSRDHLVFVTIYLSDIGNYEAMNAAYAESIPAPYPARKVIQAPMTIEGMLVEITAIAAGQEKSIIQF